MPVLLEKTIITANKPIRILRFSFAMIFVAISIFESPA
jgi:hypothetical protein